MKGEYSDAEARVDAEAENARARILPAAARRALEEAEARRKAPQPQLPEEIAGRNGPEPTRYGDWERKGLICDF